MSESWVDYPPPQAEIVCAIHAKGQKQSGIMETRLYQIDSYLSPDEHFHFARKSLDPSAPGEVHGHDFYEVFIVAKGTLRHEVNGKTQLLEAGHAVFMRPNDVHSLSAAETPCVVLNVLFREETAEHLKVRYRDELVGRFFWMPGPMPASCRLSDRRLEEAVAATMEMQTAQRRLTRIEEYLLTLMTRVIDVPEAAGASLPVWLVTACEMARDPEIFRDGAAGFVRAAGRGHEHVCRKTKEYLGITPSAYINRIRMEHAAHLLVYEDRSVSDVAGDVGIENMSHFYRVFRQHYGVTPKVYRRQHQKSPF